MDITTKTQVNISTRQNMKQLIGMLVLSSKVNEKIFMVSNGDTCM